ncbi:MAG: sulfite exporter TauE/SafE family protein [Clostridia bacterium]|nr:sulfite exporter TauE/SafE family protein [Clostridia bacterium]
MHGFFIKLIVCLIAGLGAGVGTGLSGLSAAAIISPMLITFLDMDSYMAVGIALASDVLASAVSAYTYGKNDNLDIKNGRIMLVTVLIFTMLGSYAGTYIPQNTMGSFSLIMTTVLGIKFIFKPVMTTKEANADKPRWVKIMQSIFCGIVIGFICGFVGAGGGMMMLFILTSILGYELKTAVGTSTFIMAFTAFVGSSSHFAFMETTVNFGALFWCVLFTFVGAQLAAKFANKASPVTLNRVTGAVLTFLGLMMFAVKGLK